MKRRTTKRCRNRKGLASLEVVLVLAILLVIAMSALYLAHGSIRGLYSIISLWVGSPYF